MDVDEISKRSTCLLRLEVTKPREHECIVLDIAASVTMGRGDTCDVVLTESVAVSRKHCLLVNKEGDWTITDLNSGNGVYINNNRITRNEAHPLKDRDVIEIGKNSDGAAYKFQFYKQAKIVARNPGSQGKVYSESKPMKRPGSDLCSPSSLIRDKIRQKEKWLEQDMKAKLAEKEQEHLDMLAQVEADKNNLLAQLSVHLHREDSLRTQQEDYQRRMKEIEHESSEKETELHALLLEQDSDKKTLQEKLTTLQQDLERQQQQQQAEKLQLEEIEKQRLVQLEETKKELALKEQLVDHCSQKQQQLQAEMEQKLLQERKRLMEDLKKERELHSIEKSNLKDLLTHQMKEREAQLQSAVTRIEEMKNDDMLKMKQTLEVKETEGEQLRVSISKLECDQNQYKIALEHYKNQAMKVENIEIQTKTQMVSSFEDLVESELICPICSELFVKATSLGCSHSFCSLCILKWMERKKECPNCRQKIKSHVQSLVLDNYIDRLMEILSAELKEHRKTILKDRQEEQKSWDSEQAAKARAAKQVKEARQAAVAATNTARAEGHTAVAAANQNHGHRTQPTANHGHGHRSQATTNHVHGHRSQALPHNGHDHRMQPSANHGHGHRSHVTTNQAQGHRTQATAIEGQSHGPLLPNPAYPNNYYHGRNPQFHRNHYDLAQYYVDNYMQPQQQHYQNH